MRTGKVRLTVTVDPPMVQAGHDAVAAGQAASLSAWVNVALADRAANDRRLRALGRAIDAYEDEFGAISEDEIAQQRRADQAAARVVRGSRQPPARSRARRRGVA